LTSVIALGASVQPAAAGTPALALTKSHSGNFTVGQNGNYTVSAANTGDGPTAGTITIVDTLPTGLTYISAAGTDWTCSAAGQSVTCTSPDAIAAQAVAPSVTITVGVTAAGSVTNTATVSGGGASNSATANDPTTILPSPATLGITKSHAGNFTVGSLGTYTIVPSDSGGSATSGTITVIDTLPTGLSYNSASGTGWACGSSGQTVTCTSSTAIGAGANGNSITLNVNVLAAAVPSVTNTVSASGGGASNAPTATDPTTVAGAPALQANKSHSGSFVIGLTGTYSLSVTNAGTSATTGTLTYVDTLPAAFTYASASGTGWTCAAAGQVVTCTTTTAIANGSTSPTISLVVNVVGPTGTATNSATASGGGAGSSSTKTDATNVVNNVPVAGATKAHVGNFVVGQNGVYTITPSNSGALASSGTVTVTDTLPTGFTYVSATGTGWTCGAAGQAVTCTSTTVIAAGTNGNPITLTVAVGIAAFPNVTNSATVAITGGGSATSNNPTQVDNGARLVATKTHSGNFTDGQNGVWTIGLSNTGSTATSGTITLTDTLQTGLTFVSGVGTNWTCSAAGQVVTCTTATVLNPGDVAPTIALTVLAGPASVGTFTNTVIPSGGNAAVYANGTNSTVVKGVPRLALTKTHSGTFYAGLQATYTLTPTNTGTLATSGTLTLVDTLPTGLNYVSASGVGWVCGNAGQVVTCTSTVAIALGANGNTLGVTVNPQPAAVPSVTNSATLSGGGAATPATASDPTTVAEAPVLGISKSHVGNFVAGTNGTYTIAPINSGAQATSGTYTVVDTLPTGLTFVSAAGTGWSCADAGATVTCTNANVIAASSLGPPITLVVGVAASAVPSVTNSAGSSGGGAPNTGSATDVTTVTIPVLAVTKSHVASFVVGQNGTYTITARNTGNATTFGTTTVTDTLPTGLLFASATGSGWTCSATAQVVTCTSTAAIASATAFPAITLNVTVPTGTAPGSVTNSVTASGGDASNTASATDPTTLSQPQLTIAKSHAGSFPVGGSGSYTVTAGNSGNGATFGTTTVTDTLPAGLTYASAAGTGWTCGATAQVVTCTSATSVAAAGSFPAITVNVTVPPTTPAGSLTNSATASGGGAPNAPVATDPTTIAGAPVLALAKSHTGSFVAGQTGTYALNVGNTGNVATSGTITVTDTLPAGLSFNAASGVGWTCGAAGAVVTCTSATPIAVAGNAAAIALTVNVAANAPATVTNSANASGGGAANTPVATDPTTVVTPVLAIAKSHTGNFTSGSTGTYAIVVSNSGTSATTGTLTVTDTLPAGLTFNAASGTGWTCGGSGQTATCTSVTSIAASGSGNPITLIVNVAGAAGSLTNSVTVSGGGASNAPTATDPTTLSGAPVLALAKSHTGSFVAGQTGTYALVVSNSGNLATSGTLTVTDTLPTGLTFNAASGTGWTCSAAGGVVTCTSATAIAAAASGNAITLTVHVAANAPASVTNTANASGGGAANTPAATDPTTVVTPVLAITKTHAGNFTVGATGTYTIAVSNPGTSATTGTLTVTDTLPAGLTFNAASGTGWTCVGSGQTATCTSATPIAATANGNPIALTVNVTGAPGSVTNSVTVSGGGAANAPAATDPTTLSGGPALALAKSHTGSFVAGQTGSYALVVSNSGNAATSGTITVTDTLPAGLSFNAASGTGWTCSAAGAVVTCTSATAIAMSANGNPIALSVHVAAGAPASVTNSAGASGGGAANTPTATDPTTIVTPVLAIAKTHTGNFTIGATGTYTIAVGNSGTSATAGTLTVIDTLPAGLTFNAASGTGWTCAGSGQSATCTSTASIAAGANANPIALTVNAVGPAGSVTNSVTVSGGGAGNTPVATDPTTFSGSPVLALAKSHTGSFVAGLTGSYALVVSNSGNAATSGTITVTDTLPAGLSFNAASGTGWTCSAAGAVVTCTSATAIAAAASGNAITLTVHVAANAPASVTNSANASGGGAANTSAATDPTTIVTPVLAIAKSHTGNFTIGATGTYTIAVGNSGTSATAGTLTVTDTLPAGLTFNAASGTGWTCSGAGQTVTCTSATSIAAGAYASTIALTVNAVGPAGAVTNSVTVSGGGAANTPIAVDPTTLSGSPVLALAKSHAGSFVAGQTGSYALVVSNTGGAPSAGTIAVTDTLPAGLTFNAASGTGWTCSAASQIVTCTSASAIAAAASAPPIALIANVATNAAASLTNTAAASGGGASASSTATDPTAIVRPVLALAKSHSGNFTVGATGTYTLAVGNVGTAPTTGPIIVTDTLPAGLTFKAALGTGWTCAATAPGVVCTTSASIAAGGNASPIALTVNALAAAVPQLTNRATASGGGAGNTPAASDPTIVTGSTTLAGVGGLAIQKLVDAVRSIPAAPASSVTYTIGFENTGSVAATGVVFSDTFPAGIAPILASVTVNGSATGFTAALSGRTLTVTIGVLAPAVPQTVAIRATVSPAVTTGQTFVNTGSVSANGIAAIHTTPASVFNGSANIVYNASTKAPIAGATIGLLDPATGKPVVLETVAAAGAGNARSASASGSSTANPQTTAANGSFSFALGPAQFGQPGGSETYRVTVAAHGFNNRSIQAVFAADATGLLYTVTLTALDGQPLAIEGGFTIVTRSTKISDVLNIIGNVPMFAAGALEVQKQADRTAASIGDRVVYTVTLDATQAFGATRIVDQLPAGLVYAARSGTLDDAAVEPRSSGSTQIWQLPSLALGTHTLRYAAILGPSVNQNSRLENVVDVTAANPGGGTVQGTAQATVQTIAGPFSDRLTILGRVVIGSADGGWTSVSRGVAGVRVTMEDGTTVVTDAQGRFSFQEVRPAAHVLRLDTSSLPDGVAAHDTHDYNDPRSTVRLVHTVMDTRLIQDVIFVVEEQR